MLASFPQALNTSYSYVVEWPSSGTPMVTKFTLHFIALVLLSPQMELSLFHAMGELSQYETLILEQL